MFASRSPFAGLRLFLALILVSSLTGCLRSIENDEAGVDDGVRELTGEIDPVAGSFVMKRVEGSTVDGVPVHIELAGRFVRPPTRPGEVALAVAIRNLDQHGLYAPAELILSDFVPPSVSPAFGNPDWIICPTDSAVDSTSVNIPAGCKSVYDYSGLLGDDRVLSPGETSGEKLMVFHDPENVSFSFRVQARFGLTPNRPQIAGFVYGDANRNGQPDPDEPPFGGGTIRVTGPGFAERFVPVNEDGKYSVHVREAGLYNLWAFPPPTFAPVEPTTSNPLEVVLLRGPDGQVQSFLHADFGFANMELYAPVLFLESTDSLLLDQYDLMAGTLSEHLLHLRVGFSGCNDDHPFQLFMIGGFMESNPVQARLVLEHDDRDEPCDAFWTRDLSFDLRPIRIAYRSQYGEPGIVILRFEEWNGDVHTFELGP